MLVILFFCSCAYIDKNFSMRIVLSIVFVLVTTSMVAQKKDPVVVAVVDTSIFTKVDVEASVDRDQWIEHLVKNLQSPIEKAAKKGMKAGTYAVNVRFLVEKDGSIADVQALNDPGYGLAKAAEKVLRTGPKWRPGEQNGKKVRSYHTQPITFVIQEV
jgi:periplasmic protein TonB